MSGLLNNLIECSICYENKTPYYSDNVGCRNYKKICIDCVPLLRSNNCPFCREVHHVREIIYDDNDDILDNTNDDVTSYMQMMYETVIRIINENYNNNMLNVNNSNSNNEVETGNISNNINSNNSALNNAIERASNFNNNNFSLNNVNEIASNNYNITIENNNSYILNNYNYNNNINSIDRANNNNITNNNNARYLDLPNNLNDIFTENEINLESILLNDNINIDNINIDNILNNDLDVISDAILRASIN